MRVHPKHGHQLSGGTVCRIHTMLRRGELCALQWRDFDAEAGTLQVSRTLHQDPDGDFSTGETKTGKPGTGCVTQVSDHLWEGKYSPKWPDGKRHSRGIYAGTERECEAKLAELIRRMEAEIAEARELAAQGRSDEAMALANEKPRGVRRTETTVAGAL